jgi:hypothetical protein
MKKLSLVLVLTIIGFASFAQTKKELVIKVDSADAVKLFQLLDAGLSNLMNSSIPAKELAGVNSFGQNLLSKQIAIYNSWFPPAAEPAKKDTTSKKK